MIMRIKELREAQGLTQKQVADSMGVLATTVSNWESEVALPRARELPHLAHVLGRRLIDDLYLPWDEEVC